MVATKPVAPARGRGLKLEPRDGHAMANSRPRKGAWIEMLDLFYQLPAMDVAPARGRGLKYSMAKVNGADYRSPPQGGVD